MGKWIPVGVRKPHCPRSANALGTPVLVWPRDCGCDGFAYFGRRITGKPTFYIHGAVSYGVTHWQQMPEGPKVRATKSTANRSKQPRG